MKESIRKYFDNEEELNRVKKKQAYSTLGDAVLKTVLIERLDPKKKTAEEITKKKIAMERRDALTEIAKDIFDLENGEELEALIGHIYLEKGFDESKLFIEKNITEQLLLMIEKYVDYITIVKELLEKRKLKEEYSFIQEGPDHDPTFVATLTVSGYEPWKSEKFKKLQQAKHNAAENAYGELFERLEIK